MTIRNDNKFWNVILFVALCGCSQETKISVPRTESRSATQERKETAPSSPTISSPTISSTHFATQAAEYGGDIVFVDVSPDGKEVISVNSNGIVAIWDEKTGKEIRTFGGLPLRTNCASISPDRAYLCIGAETDFALWSLADGMRIPGLETQLTFPEGARCSLSNVMQIDFSEDSKKLLACGAESKYFSGKQGEFTRLDHQLWIWNLDDRENPTVLRPAVVTLGSRCAVFLPDGLRAVSSNRGEELYLWNLEDKSLTKRLKTKGVAFIAPMRTKPELAAIFSGEVGGIGTWNVETDDEPKMFEAVDHGNAYALAVSSDGSRMAASHWFQAGDSPRPVVLWNTSTGRIAAKLTGHTRIPLALSFSADGSKLYAGLAGGKILRWQIPKE